MEICRVGPGLGNVGQVSGTSDEAMNVLRSFLATTCIAEVSRAHCSASMLVTAVLCTVLSLLTF